MRPPSEEALRTRKSKHSYEICIKVDKEATGGRVWVWGWLSYRDSARANLRCRFRWCWRWGSAVHAWSRLFLVHVTGRSWLHWETQVVRGCLSPHSPFWQPWLLRISTRRGRAHSLCLSGWANLECYIQRHTCTTHTVHNCTHTHPGSSKTQKSCFGPSVLLAFSFKPERSCYCVTWGRSGSLL